MLWIRGSPKRKPETKITGRGVSMKTIITLTMNPAIDKSASVA